MTLLTRIIGFLHILLHLLLMTLPSVFWAVLPPMMSAEARNLDVLPQKMPLHAILPLPSRPELAADTSSFRALTR